MRIIVFIMALLFCGRLQGDNQTATVSEVLPAADLPFTLVIEQADFSLPAGIQSYVSAIYKDKWVLLAGRTNGLHGFDNGTNNFPPSQQNIWVYVVDSKKKKVYARSLTDSEAGLTPSQFDSLIATSAEFYQNGKTLYVVGGYGVDTTTGLFSTKDTLTAIDLPGLIRWVIRPKHGELLSKQIRQTKNPIFEVTGGYLAKSRQSTYLLIFGQNFQGFYTPGSNGEYTQQVRRFRISDNGRKLSVHVKKSTTPNPNFRRRDLNVVPVITHTRHATPSFLALSGVFTETGGAWTVPVGISIKGHATMEDPNKTATFKQGMNNYASATLGLYSHRTRDMYVVLFGGISFGYFEGGAFLTDPELPFINQVSAVKIGAKGVVTQHLVDAQFPVILSTQSNPGNPLLFGAGAQFFPTDHLPEYKNGVMRLDALEEEPVVVGYIVGGIQSTLPNTSSSSDSASSPYIFKVTLVRTRKVCEEKPHL